MPAQMTPTAWGQGVKNALICGAAVLVLSALGAALVLIFLEQPIFYSFVIAFAVLWGLVALAFLGTWLYGRGAGGGVLLDCGPIPMRHLFLMNAVLFPVMGLTSAATSESKAVAISSAVFWILFAAYWLIMATGRLQVRENGILRYCSLLRWGRIASYRWANDSTLLVKGKGLLSWFEGALPVPPEQKQAFQELLTTHCSARPTA